MPTSSSPQEVERAVIDQLAGNARGDAESITIEVNNGVVTLTGWVPGRKAKQGALDAALHTPGVLDVEDQLSGKRGPSSHGHGA